MSVPYSAISVATSPYTGTTLASILQTKRLSNPTICPKQPLPAPLSRPATRQKSASRPGGRSASCDMSPSLLAQYRCSETTKTPDLTIATSPNFEKSLKRKPAFRALTGSVAPQKLRKWRQSKGNTKALLWLNLSWEPANCSSPAPPSQQLGIRGHMSVFQPRKVLNPPKPSAVRVLTFLPCLPLGH